MCYSVACCFEVVPIWSEITTYSKYEIKRYYSVDLRSDIIVLLVFFQHYPEQALEQTVEIKCTGSGRHNANVTSLWCFVSACGRPAWVLPRKTVSVKWTLTCTCCECTRIATFTANNISQVRGNFNQLTNPLDNVYMSKSCFVSLHHCVAIMNFVFASVQMWLACNNHARWAWVNKVWCNQLSIPLRPCYNMLFAHGSLVRYVKLRFVHAPGMPGTFPGHHGLAIPTCITARAWHTRRNACRDR